MRSATPSIFRGSSEPLHEALRWTFLMEGQSVFSELLRKKSKLLPGAENLALSIDWKKLNAEWTSCKTPLEQAEFLGHLFLLPGFATSAFVLTLPLPQIDLRVSPSAKAQDAIILHAAPRFILELMSEWVYEILDRAQSRKGLSLTDRRRLMYLKRWNRSFRTGVQHGLSFKNRLRSLFLSRPVGESLVVDAYSFQIARQWLTSFWQSD